MIHVLYGKDDFSAQEALDEIQAKLDTDGLLADNTARVEGARAKPMEVLGLCQTVPFLGERRLVIIRGLLGRFESSGRRRKPTGGEPPLKGWEAFLEGLPDLPETSTVVLLDGEIRPQNPMLQALKGKAQVREFKPMPQGEVAAWITRRAQQYGASLAARAVAALAQLVGNKLRTLDNELQKLAVYAGERQVTEADVRAMVSLAREPSVFAMADAIVEGRTRDAASLMQRLLADGESPLRLLTTIARQYRLLLLTKELLEQRTRPAEIARRLQVQPFVIQRLLKQAPGYTIPRLRQAYQRLLAADLSVKRGAHDEETALQLLLFDLAALAAPQRAGAAIPPSERRGYSTPRSGSGSAPSALAKG